MHSYFLTKRQPIHEKGIWFWTPSTGRASVVFTVWLPPSIPFWQYSFQNLLHQTLLEDNVELLPIPQKLSGITVFFLCTPNWIQKLTWLHSQYTLLSVSGLYLSHVSSILNSPSASHVEPDNSMWERVRIHKQNSSDFLHFETNSFSKDSSSKVFFSVMRWPLCLRIRHIQRAGDCLENE